MGTKVTGLFALAGLTAVTRPFGPAAARINELWWVMFWIAVFVCVVVFVFLALAIWRRSGTAGDGANGGRAADAAGETHAVGPLSVRFVVIAGAIVPAIILVGLLIYSLGTNRVLAAPPADEALTIEVIGHQWWWEVRYPESGVVTANEMIIPVGVPVRLEFSSVDVIHSFWVPALNGKMDLIPGQTTELPIEASQPGEYFGFCAEFCGVQHAKMNVLVAAREQAAFDEWLAAQQEPAPAPSEDVTQAGQQVFLGSACVYCHTVRGTNASGKVGPDLTHLASRRLLGAGALPNTRGNLAGWIVNSQTTKPGNRMPPIYLGGDELQSLLAYLETLH